MLTFTVYTKDNCRQCEATKRWLRARHQYYTVLDYAEYTDMLTDLGVKSLPYVTTSSGDAWCGFRPDLLYKAYLKDENDDS